MVPAVDAFIEDIDLEARCVTINSIDGLIEE